MMHKDPKFASQQGEEWVPHDYGKIYARQQASSLPRLCIGASFDGTALLRDLASQLAEPFMLLYVLVVPRGRSEAGRYQSGELTRQDFLQLCEHFGEFWDGDGRHSIWLRSSDEGMVVYDRHNLIYAYGPLAQFEATLASRDYCEVPLISRSFVHQHAYHADFDYLERELTARFADRRSELRPGDENPES